MCDERTNVAGGIVWHGFCNSIVENIKRKNMKKYYIHIWLDDFRAPMVPDGESIFWLKNYDGFVSCVMGLGEKISSCIVHFDHDLGEEKSGYDCAKWLIDWCLKNDYGVPDYDIQSSNPVGRQNIESVFESYRKVFFDDQK